MIPTEDQARVLWDTYDLPENKRRHCGLVSSVSGVLADLFERQGIYVNKKLLIAGALLHDIDKNVPKKPKEQHPDAAVRILREHDMEDVARLISTHPLHTIVDPELCPKTIEEKILFLSDKMVKYDIISVDERFSLWKQESLPPEGKKILEMSYPLVKSLEQEIFSMLHILPSDVRKLV